MFVLPKSVSHHPVSSLEFHRVRRGVRRALRILRVGFCMAVVALLLCGLYQASLNILEVSSDSLSLKKRLLIRSYGIIEADPEKVAGIQTMHQLPFAIIAPVEAVPLVTFCVKFIATHMIVCS